MENKEEILKEIKNQEIENIVNKLKKGKTLTVLEKNVVTAHYGPGNRKRNKELTSNQLKYCALFVSGEHSKVACYQLAFPDCTTKKSASTLSQRLGKNPLVIAQIAHLRKRIEDGTVMEAIEKREYLARVVRGTPRELSKDSKLTQEYTEKDDAFGNKTIHYKGCSKLDAIKLDNQMAGHNEPEKHVHEFASGVMLVPADQDQDEFERELLEEQRALKLRAERGRHN
ncbi:hypothetical protein N8Z76_00510 [Gammaproteobacteria bacterium]|nr:hypothetical protein [Gammaproteobacteria bacterium]